MKTMKCFMWPLCLAAHHIAGFLYWTLCTVVCACHGNIVGSGRGRVVL